ncbi:MAG: hypothetical protein QM346_08820 [Chloroflexota bacterium]|nr:hypothetical protein [Chloroflexota bacterium]
MNSSEFSRITDELLSAYIDNAVTAQERKLVEAASAADAEIAWRLDSLRQTVNLLHGLPEISLPRSFVLHESQVMEAVAPSRGLASHTQPGPASFLDRFSRGWRSFWQPGNPILRNAAAAALVLLLVLAGGDALLGDLSFRRSLQAPAGDAAPIQFAAPAGEAEMAEAAPAAAPVQVAAADTAEDASAAAAEEAAEEAAAITEEEAAVDVAGDMADASAEDGAPAMAAPLAEKAPAEPETALAAQAAPEPQATPVTQPTAQALADEPPAAAAAMAQPGPSGGELPPDVVSAEEAMIFGALGIGGDEGRGGAPGPRAAAPQEAPEAALEFAPAPPAMPLPDESPIPEQEAAAEEAVETFATGEMTETASGAETAIAEIPEMPAPAAEAPAQEEAEEAAPPAETDAGEQEAEAAPAALAKAADEHAALPIATASLVPTQTPSVAPAYSPLREPYPEPVARSVNIGFPGVMQWAQLGLALAVFILGVLWWRSRSAPPPGSRR